MRRSILVFTVVLTELHLQAASSKKPLRMNCLLPIPSQAAIFITPAEIQGVVGGYMELKIAPYCTASM